VAAVVVVGSVNVDMAVRVAQLPGPGETVVGGEYWRAPGGKGGNQAVAAARIGGDVSLLAAVGDDDLGAGAIDDLHSEGVDVDAVRRVEGAPTGVALIMVDSSGENLIAVASGANARLSAADVESGLARIRPRVVLAALEVPDEAVLAAAHAAAAVGATFVLNPAPFRPIAPELLAQVQVLTPNQHEAFALAGGEEAGTAGELRESCRRFSAALAGDLVVTLGPEGAALYSHGRETIVSAPAVAAVDATGAGDAFSGILAVGLAEGRPLPEAVRRAVAGATMATRSRGARTGLPNRAELEAFLGS
jgi:ribokinase